MIPSNQGKVFIDSNVEVSGAVTREAVGEPRVWKVYCSVPEIVPVKVG